ncbi:MAG: thermonuclease family protein [Hydrogenophaga sp.]
MFKILSPGAFPFATIRAGFFALASAVLSAMAPGAVWAQSAETVYAAKVGYIFDGDTLWVLPEGGGRSRKMRLEGIDAPEICQPGGVAARDALRKRFGGKMVTVRGQTRDTYGRPLVVLEAGGEDVAEWMVQQGWAWSYQWRGDPGPYARQEAQAKRAKRGIFEEASAEEPRAFRRRNGPCQRR